MITTNSPLYDIEKCDEQLQTVNIHSIKQASTITLDYNKFYGTFVTYLFQSLHG